MSDTVAAAQAQADEAWATHEQARGPMRADLVVLLHSLEGVTGLTAGPGAERLADAFLDYAEYHSDALHTAHTARSDALDAQQARDDALAAEPPAEPAPEPSMLDTADELSVREWLKSANDADVLELLSNVPDRDDQVEWARKMMGWCRQDGNVAQVLVAINSVLVPANPATIPDGGTTGGTGGTSSYVGQVPETASAGDEPTGRDAAADEVPDGDVGAIVSWINHGADDAFDIGRAREAYDAEISRPDPRPDVLSTLVDMLDVHVEPAPEPEPEPEPATTEGTTEPTT